MSSEETLAIIRELPFADERARPRVLASALITDVRPLVKGLLGTEEDLLVNSLIHFAELQEQQAASNAANRSRSRDTEDFNPSFSPSGSPTAATGRRSLGAEPAGAANGFRARKPKKETSSAAAGGGGADPPAGPCPTCGRPSGAAGVDYEQLVEVKNLMASLLRRYRGLQRDFENLSETCRVKDKKIRDLERGLALLDADQPTSPPVPLHCGHSPCPAGGSSAQGAPQLSPPSLTGPRTAKDRDSLDACNPNPARSPNRLSAGNKKPAAHHGSPNHPPAAKQPAPRPAQTNSEKRPKNEHPHAKKRQQQPPAEAAGSDAPDARSVSPKTAGAAAPGGDGVSVGDAGSPGKPQAAGLAVGNGLPRRASTPDVSPKTSPESQLLQRRRKKTETEEREAALWRSVSLFRDTDLLPPYDCVPGVVPWKTPEKQNLDLLLDVSSPPPQFAHVSNPRSRGPSSATSFQHALYKEISCSHSRKKPLVVMKKK
ncbi:hypothetical protein DIPPA_08938 [Diplonema papillatum]|nr:hypothetical protein DIPPA_08938 [Diplonema papillatum]